MKIDIRSDTVTWPTAAMRKAMAEAEVGDDVYGDDPTVKRLEELAAKLMGKEASVFVPSGTCGNQLALFTWCPRGSEVVLGEESHIVIHEAGASAIIAGVQLRCISAPDGVLKPMEVQRRLRKRGLHEPPTSLICIENAHSSGRVVSLAQMAEIKKLAAQWGLPVHLDGARIFNAAAALGCNAGDIAAKADSVMFCLSKGLCAPVGSILAGPKDFIEEARMKRKIMGAGMRQVGILAAAGIIALNDHPSMLVTDHERARKLAKGLAEIKGIEIDPGTVDINMVFFNYPVTSEQAAKKYVEDFAKYGIVINPPELGSAVPGTVVANAAFRGAPNDGTLGTFRFVIHHMIGDKELEAILKASAEIFGSRN